MKKIQIFMVAALISGAAAAGTVQAHNMRLITYTYYSDNSPITGTPITVQLSQDCHIKGEGCTYQPTSSDPNFQLYRNLGTGLVPVKP